MLKKLIAYLDLRVFLTFHTCSLTPLEPNLTVVAWRAKKVWSSGAEVHQTFSVAQKELRTFIMAYTEKTHKRDSHVSLRNKQEEP
jgi:hypothetical protein